MHQNPSKIDQSFFMKYQESPALGFTEVVNLARRSLVNLGRLFTAKLS